MSHPAFYTQRFWSFKLNELLDFNTKVIGDFIRECDSRRSIADKVIREVEYPFYLGQPDDKHDWNAFHGKWCRSIKLDFWQKSSETAAQLIGDCEDSAILTAAALRRFGVPSKEVYVVFGLVRDADTQEILGGHGWVVFILNDLFVLGESTLDIPPREYPSIGVFESLSKPFHFETIIYDPEFFWIDDQYHYVSSYRPARCLELGLKKKETKKKYEKIAEAWNVPTKPQKLFNKKKNILLRGLRKLVGK